ncbi:MAG: FtsX-like permease family protein [Saprospiraceae bacterium]|nr:ABC transporter permease [Lewinella sp.]
MLKNYILVAFRNLWKHKFYSIINILGLAIGLCCFLFILVFVRDELSFDKYHEKGDRTYRVNFEGFAFEQELNYAVVGAPLGPTILEKFPEVVQQCRFRDRGSYTVQYKDQSYREDKWIFADSTLFDVFSFELVQGDPKRALAEPNTLVITEDVALKYFGNEDPMGKSLKADNDELYRVSGVMKAMPRNTHFNFDLIASLSSLEESRRPAWLSSNFQTYVVLQEGADPETVNAKFPALIRENVGPELEQYLGQTYEDVVAAGNHIEFSLFPMPDIHLYSDKREELGANSDIKYVYIFTFIGVFILFLACINFMNLSTARSAARAKEIGMRKVVGAGKPQLIFQFLSESIVITFLGFLIAAGLFLALLPYFNTLSGKELLLRQVLTPGLVLLILSLVVGVGIVAGSYPAFYLSSFKALNALAGKIVKRVGQQFSLRSGLVIFQFAVTVALIVGTIVISNQLHYIQNKKLGFEKDQILILKNYYALDNNCLPFKQEVLKHPGVVNATMSSSLPTPSSRNTSAAILGRNPDPAKTHVINMFDVDHDYLNTLGMEIVQGRDFSRDRPSDSLAVILNESAVELYGLDDPLNAEISSFDGGTDENPELITYRVIGVVKNFHFESLRNTIGPLAIFLGNSRGRLSIKVNTDDMPALIDDLRRQWQDMAHGQPFSYSFMDEDFSSVYQAETRIGSIFSVFTFLAIFIACLGLFGLATFSAEQRTKEIGIRKVIGASIPRIFVMLTSEILKWVFIANLIALPLAYYFMQQWLQGFAYPVSIHWWTFGIAMLASLLIALITVSQQAIRAALRNPVQALR